MASAVVVCVCGALQVRDGSSYSQETRRIILSLEKIRKVAPNGKEVLNNINLGMYLVSTRSWLLVAFQRPVRCQVSYVICHVSRKV